MLTFPADFLWGASTSAYQVEGNNRNCDWWEWEREMALKEPSGAACRHYELFRQDFDLAQSLSHNAHRFSLEWSRIEPRQGIFSAQEINHYTEVVEALRQRRIEPVLTLHHFTNPLWFSRLGGWQCPQATKYFLNYVRYVTEALADKVNFWLTINEPMVYVYFSYIVGVWPPQIKSLAAAKVVSQRLLNAHIESARLIKDIYRSKGLPLPSVSIAKNIRAFVPCGNQLRNRLAAYLRQVNFNLRPLETLIRAKALDFIGVNYYSRDLVEAHGWRRKNLFFDVCSDNHDSLKKNSLGWDIYPRGLYDSLLKLKRYKLPVFILENGVCTDDDALRWDFIRQHLEAIHLAMEKGVKVIGYLYWSLLDNFEWEKGFSPRFGLIEVDYQSFRRTVRDSARRFALVCSSGVLGE